MDLRNYSPQEEEQPDGANAAEQLHGEFKRRLWRWAGRTVVWGIPLVFLARGGGIFKFVFAIWLLWTAISLAGLMLGLKVSRHLRNAAAGSANAGPQHRPQAWNPARENDDPDVIEIDAEVIDIPADERDPTK